MLKFEEDKTRLLRRLDAPARDGRGIVLALLVVIVILEASLGYGDVTLSGRVSDLNKTVSSQELQISSLNSTVPDSEIFAIAYTLTLWSHTAAGLNATAFHVDMGLGLPYHSGKQITLYIEADQLVNFTGLMNITNIRAEPSQGFSVSITSPSLPLIVNSGGTYGQNRSLLGVALNTPPEPYRGVLMVYVQAYSVQQTSLTGP